MQTISMTQMTDGMPSAVSPELVPCAAMRDWRSPAVTHAVLGHNYALFAHTERYDATAKRNPLVPRPRAKHG